MNNQIYAWHFVGNILRNGDPIPPDGELLRYDGDLVMCEAGLHASVRIIDALTYAPGSTVCRVVCSGDMIKAAGKLVSSERRIVWRIDGTVLLRSFARWCALTVIDNWDAPRVVSEYLETGNECLRAAARDAARAAACAARDAAWGAPCAAARDAAWGAACAAMNVELTEMTKRQHGLQGNKT